MSESLEQRTRRLFADAAAQHLPGPPSGGSQNPQNAAGNPDGNKIDEYAAAAPGAVPLWQARCDHRENS